MPYSLSSKPAAERTKAVWEGEEGCTIISPEELSYRPPPSPSPTPNLTRTTSTSLCEEQEVGVEVAVVLPQPEVLATTRPRVVVNSPTVLPSSRVNSRLNNRDHRQHQFPAGSDNNSTLGDEAVECNHLHHHHHNHNRSSGNQEALGGNGGMDGGGGEHHQNHHQYQHQQHHHHHQQQQQQHPHRRASAAESGGASHHHKTPRMDGYDSYNSNQLHDRGGQRLLVVANRLPVSAIWDGQKWDLKLSAGGLVSALLGTPPSLCHPNFNSCHLGEPGWLLSSSICPPILSSETMNAEPQHTYRFCWVRLLLQSCCLLFVCVCGDVCISILGDQCEMWWLNFWNCPNCQCFQC